MVESVTKRTERSTKFGIWHLEIGNTESRGNINALNCHGWDLQSNLGSKSTQNLQKSSKSCDLKILSLDSRRGTRKWLDSVNTNRCGMVRNRLTFILVKIAPLPTSLESFVTPTVPSFKKYVIWRFVSCESTRHSSGNHQFPSK